MRRILAALVLALTFAATASAGTVVRVDQSANGWTKRLHPGGVLVVKLPGNPSTGYRWIVANVNARVLLGTPPIFEASTAQSDGPGFYTLAFLASAPGRTRLELAHVVAGHRGGATMAFALTVVVS